MKYTVVVFVSLFAFVVTGVRSAPQRGIDFLPGDEEVQAVVKPIAGDSNLPDQQHQQAPDQVADTEDEQQRQQPEVPATVDPVENEQGTEEPSERVTEHADEELLDDPIDDQLPEENQKDSIDPVTHQQTVDTEQNSTNDEPAPTESDATTPPQKDAVPAKDETKPVDSVMDYYSEEGLTTDPIVVPDHSSTESNEDSNQLAEDVNSLADNPSNRPRFGLDDNQEQSRPQDKLAPPPTPHGPVAGGPQHSTELPPATSLSVNEEYDSKSLESHEDDDQVQVKVGPNDGQSTSEDQFRGLSPWFGPTRLTGFNQWQQQQQGGFPQRSSWQPRHYQPSSFDGFHGHGFHRSSWH